MAEDGEWCGQEPFLISTGQRLIWEKLMSIWLSMYFILILKLNINYAFKHGKIFHYPLSLY